MVPDSLFTPPNFMRVSADLVRFAGGAGEALLVALVRWKADEMNRYAYEHEGQWWWAATLTEVADASGLTIRQVRRCLDSLYQNDMIEREKHRRGGASDHVLSYRVKLASDVANIDMSERAHLDMSERAEQDVSERAYLPIKTLKTDISKDISINAHEREEFEPVGSDVFVHEEVHEEEVAVAYEVDYFATFWEIYPRKVARSAARKAWDAAMRKGHEAESVLIGLEKHLPGFRSRELRFIPHASTWLNQERFLEQPEQVDGQVPADVQRLMNILSLREPEPHELPWHVGDGAAEKHS